MISQVEVCYWLGSPATKADGSSSGSGRQRRTSQESSKIPAAAAAMLGARERRVSGRMERGAPVKRFGGLYRARGGAEGAPGGDREAADH